MFNPFEKAASERTVKHHQCSWCNIMTMGPHAGEQPGRRMIAADDDRLYSEDDVPELERRGIDHWSADNGISHGICPDCAASFMSDLRARHGVPEPGESGGDTGSEAG